MKSSGRQGSLEKSDVVICLSDDEDGDDDSYGELAVAAGDSTPPPPPAPPGELPIASPSIVTPSTSSADLTIAAGPPPSTATRVDAALRGIRSSSSTTDRGIASPTSISPSTSTRGVVPGPGGTRLSSTASAMDVTRLGVGDRDGTPAADDEKEGPRRHASQRHIQARKRNSFIQTLLSTPGCVLVIDNLEGDAQPVDVLGQLMTFTENKDRIHSVHIPPPYPEVNRAVGYVVFMNKEFADAAAAVLTRNFVVSARGRPWIVSRCVQKLNEENFGFPTTSAFQGETQDGNGDSFAGLKIVTDKQEAEYNAAKRRRVVFEQHRKQAQLMFQRHAQEEKDLEDNPDLSLYR